MLYVNPCEATSLNKLSPDLYKARKEKAVLKEFEHLLLYSMLNEMHKTASWGEKASSEEETYNEMFNDHVAGLMADSGQLGVAKQMELQLHDLETQARIRGRLAQKVQ